MLAQWDSTFLGLNSTESPLGWAGLGSGIQPHYEAPGKIHIAYVIVNCPKLALDQLVQVQVIDSASDKILKIYIYINSSSL